MSPPWSLTSGHPRVTLLRLNHGSSLRRDPRRPSSYRFAFPIKQVPKRGVATGLSVEGVVVYSSYVMGAVPSLFHIAKQREAVWYVCRVVSNIGIPVIGNGLGDWWCLHLTFIS